MNVINEAKRHPLYTGMIFIGVPLIVYALSEWEVFDVCGNNDWAGFWGGYLGSIIGGVITLYVMSKTIEVEKIRIADERKKQFDDEILEHILEYHTGLTHLTGKIVNFQTDESFLDQSQELSIKSGLIYIKIKSRSQNPEYHCDELLTSLEEATGAFNDMVTVANSTVTANPNDDDMAKMKTIGKEVYKKINNLRSCIERYYIEEQKE